MNRHEIVQRIGNEFHVGNTESGKLSYVQALNSVEKDIRDYQKGYTGKDHQYLDLRFENDRLVILVECKIILVDGKRKIYTNNCKTM